MFCHDELCFWLEAEAYSFLPGSADLAEAATLIYDTYLKEDAPHAVDVSREQREKIRVTLFCDMSPVCSRQQTNLISTFLPD